MSLFVNQQEDMIYSLIAVATFDRPIALSTLCQISGLSERTIKGFIESLCVHHGIPVGARRGSPNGYYICRTIEERKAAARPLFRQAIKELRRVRGLLDKRWIREALGQERLI